MTKCSIPCMGLEVLVQRLEEQLGQRRLAYFGSIELTPYCNLKCVHCYVTHCKWEGSILTYSELCRILDGMAEEGCFWLLLTGGEPLLRDDFLDIYTYAKKKGIFTTIFTNGTLVTPEIVRHLRDWPPRLVEVSIYGATNTTHDSVTGVAGSFERCLKGIELLLENGINVELKTVVMTLNKHEYWGMKKLAESFGVDFRLDPILNPGLDGSRQPCDLRITPEEAVRLDIEDLERREAWIKSFKALLGLPLPADTVYTCGAGNGRFHIDAFGKLQMCIMARQPYYDLRHGSFQEGWRDFLAGVRAQKLSQPSPCQTCQYRRICYICPGWSQLECGTLEIQPVEYLCQIARLRAEAFGLELNTTENAVTVDENALSRPLGRDILPENHVEQGTPALERRWSP